VLSVLSVANRIHYTYLALNKSPSLDEPVARHVQPRVLLARRTHDDSSRLVGHRDPGVRMADAA
jgi:hypothetical protein